jgi:murein DD-endopeptidase MepM/ murein hydrolase activator NlpD
VNKTKRAGISAFALLFCFVFLAGIIPPEAAYANAGIYQSQLDNINDTLKKLEDEKKTIENSIAGARSEREQEQQKRNYLDQQIRITRDEIEELLNSIELLEGQIEFKLIEISEKQAEIDENYEVFLKRIRVMYMYDDSTMLGLVLGVDSFTSFLTQTDSIARIAEHDRALLAVLAQQKADLEEARASLELAMEALKARREETEAKRHTLDGQLQAANLRIHDINETERAFLADLEKNKAMTLAMEQELKEVYEKIELMNSPYVGGVMAWPAPGFTRISSEFGQRFGGRDFHTGIDIAGPGAGGRGIYGAPVAAANSGVVRFTNFTYRAGVGYGIYLIIDHGGGITTLYAHLSKIHVQVGQAVTRGQTIAEVGSTGWSTGPHLHFEVRNGSTAQNPRPYIFR